MPLFTGGHPSEDHDDAERVDEPRAAPAREVRILENTAEQMAGPPGSVAARFFVGGQDIDFSSLQNLLFAPRDSPNITRGAVGPRGMGSSSLAARQTRERLGGQEREGSNPGPSTSARGAGSRNEASVGHVIGGAVLGQLLSSPWSNTTQPRTAGRRRPRENADRQANAGLGASGGGRGDGGTGGAGGSAGGETSLPTFTALINPSMETSDGGERFIEFPLPEGFSVPNSFALPILGSREMTELFNEIFDSSRQDMRRSRVRRDDQAAGNAADEGDPSNRRSTRSVRNRPVRNTTASLRPMDIIRDLEIESRRLQRIARTDENATRAFSRTPNPTSPSPQPYTGKPSRSPPNWFLKPGQTWNGWQHVQHWPPGTSERWSVRVVLDFVNFEKGEVFGTMTASNVPGAENNVVTYFEGEIIDNENSTFYSNPDASARMCLAELRHWSRFPSFRPLRDSVLEEDGRAPALAESGKVFMRWKEKCFLSGGADCRLTIAGLYYVTLDRVNGDIHAYYWDPNSAPEQRMSLKVGSSHQQGYALPVHKVA